MRKVLAVVLALGGASVVGLGIAGCGAAPGYDEGTTPAAAELQPLTIGRPDAQLAGIDGVNANFVISVTVANPNAAPVTMRRVDGYVFLQEQQVAHVEVQGEEILEAQQERRFQLAVAVPLAVVMQLQASEYVARGTVYADGGSGDGALQTPFELTGAVPR